MTGTNSQQATTIDTIQNGGGLHHFTNPQAGPGAPSVVPDAPPAFNPLDDLDYLWSNFDTDVPGPSFDQDRLNYFLDMTSLPQYEVYNAVNLVGQEQEAPRVSEPANQREETQMAEHREDTHAVHFAGLESYNSRLPSLEPPDTNVLSGSDLDDSTRTHISPQVPESRRFHSFWKITLEDYATINDAVQSQQSYLPAGFELPSKHALHRYFDGYFTGFLKHLPILHTPTMSTTGISLALFLAIAAMGAQYRFERQAALQLFGASKALIENKRGLTTDHTRRFTPIDPSQGSYSTTNPTCGRMHDREEQHGAEQLELLQAMIILMAFATYNHHSLLQDAVELANCIVHDMRKNGMLEENEAFTNLSWEDWAMIECRRRTVLGAFNFTNIQSVLYDFPPLLLSSDIRKIQLPQPEQQWRAQTVYEWETACQTNSIPAITFGESYDAHLTSEKDNLPRGSNISSFGNWAVIHGILQQIYLMRQVNLVNFDLTEYDRSHLHRLPTSAVNRLGHALAQWKCNWEATREASISPTSSSPLAFNSTALFRIACIRLHSNLGPYLKFQTRDPQTIAKSIRSAPLPARSLKLYGAILQSAHSLSIPVWFGLNYVARIQTLTWSIVHTLCNVECAFFLSKWLESIALCVDELLPEEERLLGIVTSILNETDYKLAIQAEQNTSKRTKRIGVAIVRLLAGTLKGVHVFELVEVLCLSLEAYASILEKTL